MPSSSASRRWRGTEGCRGRTTRRGSGRRGLRGWRGWLRAAWASRRWRRPCPHGSEPSSLPGSRRPRPGGCAAQPWRPQPPPPPAPLGLEDRSRGSTRRCTPEGHCGCPCPRAHGLAAQAVTWSRRIWSVQGMRDDRSPPRHRAKVGAETTGPAVVKVPGRRPWREGNAALGGCWFVQWPELCRLARSEQTRALG